MNNKSKNYILNEPRPLGKTIKIPITINESKNEAILDRGSDKNTLTANVINTLRLNPGLMAKPEEVEIADGTKLKITREIDLTFTLYDHKNIKYTSRFHIFTPIITTP